MMRDVPASCGRAFYIEKEETWQMIETFEIIMSGPACGQHAQSITKLQVLGSG